MTAIAFLVVFLYGGGVGLAYALAPLWLPIQLAGRTWRRLLFSLLWPFFGWVFLVVCFATNWA